VDQVHGAVDRWRARVHGGLRVARTLGTVAPHRRALVHECYNSPELTDGGRGGRGRRCGLGGVLIGAQVVVMRWHDGGGGRR
jgi:hypothetical protein